MRKHLSSLVVVIVIALLLGACSGLSTTKSQDIAVNKAEDHQVYIPKNDLEFNNYNDRQILADSLTTILWCTIFPPTPGSPLVTTPIVGKLTSGTKRPYATEYVSTYSADKYTPELPGPDGMFGPSDPNYRYGFTPGHNYWDYTAIPMVCTDEPTVWQKESTTLVLDTDQQLLEAQKRAQDALARGNKDEAEAILAEAIKIAGGN